MNARLIDLLKYRQDQTYDGECHLSNEEADEIIAALAAAPVSAAEPNWEGTRYEAAPASAAEPKRRVVAWYCLNSITGKDDVIRDQEEAVRRKALPTIWTVTPLTIDT